MENDDCANPFEASQKTIEITTLTAKSKRSVSSLPLFKDQNVQYSWSRFRLACLIVIAVPIILFFYTRSNSNLSALLSITAVPEKKELLPPVFSFVNTALPSIAPLRSPAPSKAQAPSHQPIYFPSRAPVKIKRPHKAK
jgi:hypothetical protein